MKKYLLTNMAFIVIGSSAFAQGWVGNSSTNSLFGVNSSTGLSPLFVGIGTNSPTAQFHTTGDVRFEGVTQDNSVTQILGTDVNGNVFWRDANNLLSNAWLLTGNAGTNPTINFMGTTDPQPVIFKTNNVEQMRINVSNSTTGIGPVEIGQSTSNNGNLTVWGRDIVGYSFPFNISSNVAGMLWSTAASTPPGVLNTQGRMMRFTQSGGIIPNLFYDIGIGQQGEFFLTGPTTPPPPGPTPPQQKTFVIDRFNNVGINLGTTPVVGANFHTSGSVRHSNLPAGTGNVLVIDANGDIHNSGIAAGSGVQNACNTNNMIPKVTNSNGNLGCSQIYDNGNSVGIGPTVGTSTNNFSYTWSGGLAGTTPAPTSGTVRLDIEGVTRALAYIATSDERLKSDIKPISDPISIVNKLEGKTYIWNKEVQNTMNADGGRQYGFLAQEVAKVMPEAVVVDKQGKYGMNYNMLIPVLTEAMKGLYTDVQNEKAKNELLTAKINDLEARIKSIEDNNTPTDIINSNGTSSETMLFQNVPNPFNGVTEIRYKLAQNYTNADIMIFDMNGKKIKQLPIQDKEGKVTVSGSDLAAGMYMYSLIIDGQEIATKRMVINK